MSLRCFAVTNAREATPSSKAVKITGSGGSVVLSSIQLNKARAVAILTHI